MSARHRRLADDTQTRITMLVENSAPNPDRPRLNPERERRLLEVEKQTAACYASMEELRFKIGRLVANIRERNLEADLIDKK